MTKVLYSILLILCVGHVNGQRISEIKCYDYSLIRTKAAKALPHVAVWVGRINQLIISSDVLLISDNFLISAMALDPTPKSVLLHQSRVYFAINEWYDVTQEIRYPSFDERSQDDGVEYYYDIVLLKISRIRLDSYHRPACLFTRDGLKPNTVDVVVSNLALQKNASIFFSVEREIDEHDLAMVLMTFETSYDEDACIEKKLEGSDRFCLGSNADQKIFDRRKLLQIRRPLPYLPNNYYVFGFGYLKERDNNLNVTYTHLAKPIASTIDWIESQVWGTTDPTCGKVEISEQPMIFNAMPTVRGEFPWHIGLYHLSRSGDKTYACGGTLLNELTVITAAHCVVSSSGVMSPFRLLVKLGKHDFVLNAAETRESRILNVTVHNEYNHNNFDNDIAILKLDTIINYSRYIKPICITSNDRLFENEVGVLPGWGLTELGDAPPVLSKGSFPIRPYSDCRGNGNGIASMLSPSNFCAGYENGTTVCRGDSGGGLVYKMGNQWFLKGIVSVGVLLSETGQCDALGLSLFTDVVKFHDWIIDNL